MSCNLHQRISFHVSQNRVIFGYFSGSEVVHIPAPVGYCTGQSGVPAAPVWSAGGVGGVQHDHVLAGPTLPVRAECTASFPPIIATPVLSAIVRVRKPDLGLKKRKLGQSLAQGHFWDNMSALSEHG